ncbi:hypothetical protein IE53DRAFT_271895 [Violaceomyces palustris]|uniref:Uncharacterized protein n=1 Tax=Violaceomyces palustris TaxID=1673888 RepID=A0ACD0P3Q3_9BASI|nr:hypothetical protein IE53DRAFT_271895 [Violaceomyces palustris]
MSHPSSSYSNSDAHLTPVTVTYSASPALLQSPLTDHFVRSLDHQLPLRNIHWKPSPSTFQSTTANTTTTTNSSSNNNNNVHHDSAQFNSSASHPNPKPAIPRSSSGQILTSTSIRTIQTLPVSLKPLFEQLNHQNKLQHGFDFGNNNASLLDKPFAHLYLVVCDDSDKYRTTVRNEIKAWINSLSSNTPAAAAANVPFTSSSSSNLTPSGSRTSLALRSSTPPVRPETPSSTGGGGGAGAGGGSSSPRTPSGTPGLPSTTAVSATAIPEYLIILINPPEGSAINYSAGVTASTGAGANPEASRTGMGRFYSKSKGSVIEKMKADFNSGKKEHVVHVTRLPPPPASGSTLPQAHLIDPTIWAEMLTRLKECASTAFGTAVAAQEEEIRRLEAGKSSPGWDLCSYFIARETLARTLEGVGLRDDAVAQYEDLEGIFSTSNQDHVLSFAPVGGTSPGDDSKPLLDINKKPYQDLIRRREITLFDFRCYLFTRRAVLLGKLGRVVQVMRETPPFIGAVSKMLSDSGPLSPRMIESWIFSASLDVVDRCQAWLIERGDTNVSENQLSPAFHSAKAELLELARAQLDRLGMTIGHLPTTMPFCLPKREPPTGRLRDLPPLPHEAATASSLRDTSQVTRTELVEAIKDAQEFYNLYLGVTERVISASHHAGRKRSVQKLRANLASLDFHRERLSQAYMAFLSLPEGYAETRWNQIEAHLLARQLECHKRLGKPRDKAWLSVIIAMLRALALDGGAATHGSGDPGSPIQRGASADTKDLEACLNRWEDPKYLFQELRAAASSFDREVPVSGFEGLSVVPLSNRAIQAVGEDGSRLRVEVGSCLDFELAVEDVRICLTGPSKEQVWFTTGPTILYPGKTRMDLVTNGPSPGSYVIDVSQIRLSKVIFQYAAAGGGGGKATSNLTPLEMLKNVIKIPRDGDSLDVDLQLPSEIHLDRPRLLELIVSSGRNQVETAEISILDAGGNVYAGIERSELVPPPSVEEDRTDLEPSTELQVTGTSTSEAKLRITNLAPRSNRILTFPLSSSPSDGNLRLTVKVTYWTTNARPQVRRQLVRNLSLLVSLPLGVNVQDFFRTESLFSRFSISAGGNGAIRLKPVRLEHEPRPTANQADGGPTESEDGGGGEVFIQSQISDQVVTVTPRQPASFLFRIKKTRPRGEGLGLEEEGQGGLADQDVDKRHLRLYLTYRPLKEEAKSKVLSLLDHQDEGKEPYPDDSSRRRLLERDLKRFVDERLDLPAMSLWGEIRFGAEFDERWWRSALESWGGVSDPSSSPPPSPSAEVGKKKENEGRQEDAKSETLEKIQRILNLAGKISRFEEESKTNWKEAEENSGWRLLSIPVDVPKMQVVNSVRIDLCGPHRIQPSKIDPPPMPLVVGVAVDVEISIRSCFSWGDLKPSSSSSLVTLSYEVMTDFETWLVSGSKRGTLTIPLSRNLHQAEPIRLQLVPLKTGLLNLPNVIVRPVVRPLSLTPPPPFTTTEGVGEQQQVIVKSCETFVENSADSIQVVPRRWRSQYQTAVQDLSTRSRGFGTGGGAGGHLEYGLVNGVSE